jgi:hypothetical protein
MPAGKSQDFVNAKLARTCLAAKAGLIFCGVSTCHLAYFQRFIEAVTYLSDLLPLVKPPNTNDQLWATLKTLSEESLLPYSCVVKMVREKESSKSEAEKAMTLLITTRDRRATDPRDKVYSIVGWVDLGLKPDYLLLKRNSTKPSVLS